MFRNFYVFSLQYITLYDTGARVSYGTGKYSLEQRDAHLHRTISVHFISIPTLYKLDLSYVWLHNI